MRDKPIRAILMPGGVLPAALAYPSLIEALGDGVDARAKELELYATDTSPDGWTLQTEVEGIRSFADDAGFDTFHLVGYSGGGACALAFCSAYPERLASLALSEPAWTGDENLSEMEREVWRETHALVALPEERFMAEFVRLILAPGVDPPPPADGPAPPWMAKRPAGLKAFIEAFVRSHLDAETLRKFDRPVLFTMCGKTNPRLVVPPADRLGSLFPDFTVDVFEDRHHFDPPHRAEPERYARSLRQLWARAGD